MGEVSCGDEMESGEKQGKSQMSKIARVGENAWDLLKLHRGK
jgi:hypothetical protein